MPDSRLSDASWLIIVIRGLRIIRGEAVGTESNICILQIPQRPLLNLKGHDPDDHKQRHSEHPNASPIDTVTSSILIRKDVELFNLASKPKSIPLIYEYVSREVYLSIQMLNG
jgi:hypothetical protein